MMNPMMGGPSAFPVFMIIHGFAGVLIILALLSLIGWAWKSWSATKMKTVGLWMLGIGIVLCALSTAAVGGPMAWKHGGMSMMRTKMMDSMMKELDAKDVGASAADKRTHEAMRAMMREMMEGSASSATR